MSLRRIRIIAAVVGATLVVTAVALAAQTNVYVITGAFSPSRAGTTKKPVPVSVRLRFAVREAGGQRPALIDRYAVSVDGLQVNGGRFPRCTAAKINRARTDSDCPARALVGTGAVENEGGPTTDPSAHALKCHLDLKAYNGGSGKLALFLKGGQTRGGANDPKNCPYRISRAIDATFAASGKGASLRFAVPAKALLHPFLGGDSAMVRTTLRLRRITTSDRGRTVGYLESTGGCHARKRALTATFRTVSSQTGTAHRTLICSSS